MGSFFVGKVGQGITQIILYIIGLVLIFTAIGSIIGIPLCVGVWIWGLVTAATSPEQPVQVAVTVTPTISDATSNLTKKCPDCAETIMFEANVCKYCHRTFSKDEIAIAVPMKTAERMNTETVKQTSPLWGGIVIGIMIPTIIVLAWLLGVF